MNPGDLIVGDAMGVVVVPQGNRRRSAPAPAGHESANWPRTLNRCSKGNFSNAWVDQHPYRSGMPDDQGFKSAASDAGSSERTEPRRTGSKMKSSAVASSVASRPLLLGDGQGVSALSQPAPAGVGRQHAAFTSAPGMKRRLSSARPAPALGSGICEIERDGNRFYARHRERQRHRRSAHACGAARQAAYEPVPGGEGLPVPRHTTFTLGNHPTGDRFPAAKTAAIASSNPPPAPAGAAASPPAFDAVSHLARAARQRGDLLRSAHDRRANRGRQLPPAVSRWRADRLRPPPALSDCRWQVFRQTARDAANDERLRRGRAISQVLLTIDMDMQRTLSETRPVIAFDSPPARRSFSKPS